MKSVLTIAGSDPTGGAGIQADLRTFAALGLAGWSAVTALTVQDTEGVHSVYPVPLDVLRDQVRAALEDATDLGAIKIGMLADAAHALVVAKELVVRSSPPVVLDPVLASTGGVALFSDAERSFLLDSLFPLCALVTPNLWEATILAGMEFSALETEAGRSEAAQRLLRHGPEAILIKGGHLPGPPIDYLFVSGRTEPYTFSRERIDTTHAHGTGCLLSSAIASYLARGFPLVNAIDAAKKLLSAALFTPAVTGRGRGYPDALRAAVLKDSTMNTADTVDTADTAQISAPALPLALSSLHEQRMARLHGVYVLTDSDLCPGRSPEAIIRAALDGGATVVQLREKRLATPDLIDLSRHLVALTRAANALFIVNDRVDVALAADADGVHLGPDDMHPADARRLLGPDRVVGVSVSSVEEATLLAPFASYLGVGAVFGSATKHDAGPPIGTDRVVEIGRAFPHLPIVAIGGIGLDNVGRIGATGAACAAVVSAVVCAPDMSAATAALISAFTAARTESPARASPRE